MRRVYAYLVKQRGISRQMVSAFAKTGLLYEDVTHHNCVFVGKDEQGVARHAHLHSTNSTGKTFRLNVEGGDLRCSFHYIGISERLYVFEAPIDLLSYISLHPDGWQQHSYVACCGVSFQPVRWLVDQLAVPQKVFLCLDNDKAGHLACERMAGLLAEQGVSVQRLTPQRKDWNDDLVALRREQQQNVQVSSVAPLYTPQTPSQAKNAFPAESEMTKCQTFGF